MFPAFHRLMTQIADELGSDSDWIVLNLNPERDLLNAMASKLDP
mgnify:FL=1